MHNRPDRPVPAIGGTGRPRRRSATSASINWIAVTDATDITATVPDRASFAIALNTARDQLTRAAAVLAGEAIDLVGSIGRAVLDHLMPDRRLRLSPRCVRRPISRYAHKSLRVDRRTHTATCSIDILRP